MKLKLLLFYVLIVFSKTILSQDLNEVHLDPPENITPSITETIEQSTIHYGATPQNYNGEVILFTHGFSALTQLYFSNNKFYEQAYNDGYQVAFVSTTRGDGMWKNGEILAQSIDQICDKFKVKQLNIIAHSNGGKASEVAMYKYDKNDKVKRVFALGTPFWGTYVADISQFWWFNWLWKHTGLNEGTATSTTYYCRDVIRPYFDNHPNNDPEKFYIVGGSSFSRANALFYFSGSIVKIAQGSNDGIAAYSSTQRPNGNYLFSKDKLHLDHAEVAEGQKVWQHIQPILSGKAPKFKSSEKKVANDFSIVKSNYQIFYSDNKYDELKLDKNNKRGLLTFFHKSDNKFAIKSSENTRFKRLSRNKNVSSFNIYSENRKLSMSTNSKYVGFLTQSEGVNMIYKDDKISNKINIYFDREINNIQKTEINAIITKKSDITGKSTSEKTIVRALNYDKLKNKFYLDKSEFDKGVYTVHITAIHDDFKRNIISGFSVGNLKGYTSVNPKDLNNLNNSFKINLINKRVDNNLNFTVENINNNNLNSSTSFKVFNLNGQEVVNRKLKITKSNFSVNINHLASGMYILKIKNNKYLDNYKLLKQ